MNNPILDKEKLTDKFVYCNNLTSYSRLNSRVVNIGSLPLGGNNPIRIQSMTNTDTLDTRTTVEQCVRLINCGCEYVRISVPSIKDAENLFNIKCELKKMGYSNPLIADVHFNPKVAEIAAYDVEKIRINPGNYYDKKENTRINYTDKEYSEEIERIRERIAPLIKICKDNGTAIRIGSNHGSLSDRIINRYGNTPMGMVEAAMEFVRIFEELGFYNTVVSMKSSNPIVMIQSNRLLVRKMAEENMNYPLHLGVTEAGEGEDGIIKSAIGIGSLLEDGIGDTIRVSLTNDPEQEIPVARKLIERYSNRTPHNSIKEMKRSVVDPFNYKRRESSEVNNIGGKNYPVVISSSAEDKDADYYYSKENNLLINNQTNNSYPLFTVNEFIKSDRKSDKLNFVSININDVNEQNVEKIKGFNNVVLIAETDNSHAMPEIRRIIFELIDVKCMHPIIIKRNYNTTDLETLCIYSSTDVGSLLIDGLGDGVWIESEDNEVRKHLTKISFNILQSTKTRITRTEYISCPSCARTQYDIQEVIVKVKERTSHLKGLKIAVMGCIVNGPGEMADADYGCVGAGKGKVTLYKAQNPVIKNIAIEYAVDELVKLIKENGDWVDV